MQIALEVARMLRSGTIMKIKESAQAEKSAYAIGKELGISKNTARKYMQPPATAPKKARADIEAGAIQSAAA